MEGGCVRVALLSCGPSLSRTWRPSLAIGYRLIIGVNRAVERQRCDWWACLDHEAFQWFEPTDNSTPRVLTWSRSAARLAALAPERLGRHEWRSTESVDVPLGRPSWATYSGTSALALAMDLGASVIDCYGVDLAGSADFAGRRQAKRDERRWGKETAIWSDLVRLAGRRSIRVNRVAPSPERMPAAAV